MLRTSFTVAAEYYNMKLWRWGVLPDSDCCCQHLEQEIPWILLLPENETEQTPQCKCLGFGENCILFLWMLKCIRGTYPGTWPGQTRLFDVSWRVCFNPLPKEESSMLFGTSSALALAVFRGTSGLSDFQVVWVVGQALTQGWNSKTGLDTLLDINMSCSVERLFIQCTMTSYYVATSQWCVRIILFRCTRTQESLMFNQKTFCAFHWYAIWVSKFYICIWKCEMVNLSIFFSAGEFCTTLKQTKPKPLFPKFEFLEMLQWQSYCSPLSTF